MTSAKESLIIKVTVHNWRHKVTCAPDEIKDYVAGQERTDKMGRMFY